MNAHRAKSRRAVKVKAKAFAERKPMPISTAGGGPMPGIDLTDLAALEEMDDLEYVRRMQRRGRRGGLQRM